MRRPKEKGPFKLGDPHPAEKRLRAVGEDKSIMAIWDGKPKRPPQKGEWYLSGCEGYVMAYESKYNTTGPDYYIAKIVKVEIKTIITHEISDIEEVTL